MSNLYDVQSNFVKLAQENLHVQANMWLEAEDYETLNVPWSAFIDVVNLHQNS